MTEKRGKGRTAKRPQTIALQGFLPVLREARRRYGKLTESDKHLLDVLSGGDRSVEKGIVRSYKPNTPRKLIFDLEFPGRTNQSPEALQKVYDDHHRSVSRKRKNGQRDKRNDASKRANEVLIAIAEILNLLKPSGHLSVSRAATLAKTRLDKLNFDFPTPSERTLRRIIATYQSTNLATQRLKNSN